MKALLKIFLPYSLLFGIAIAVVVSHFGPTKEAVRATARDAGSSVEEMPCSGCGGMIATKNAIVHTNDSRRYYYCCDRCADRHARGDAPADYPGQGRSTDPGKGSAVDLDPYIDPVCRMEVAPSWGFEARYQGQSYYFCTAACRDRFADAPEDFLGDRCIVCDERVDPARAETATYLGKKYRVCSAEHRRQFKQDPAAFFMHTMWGIPPWMYYASISLVLVVSFGLFESWDRFTAKWTNPVVEPRDRLDLLKIGWIRFLVTSRKFRFFCQAAIVAVFFLIICAGLFGNQNPALNIAPILTWTVWWGGLVILIMFAGKAWCYVCPWDAAAGWLEKLRFWKKTDEGLGLELSWPKALRNIAIATALFVGLTWIELGFGVTMKPKVTAYLAIAMLLMAIVSAFLFERKGFCRYACLVGRVSGLYAMFSGIEVRPKDASICRTCPGKECYHGSSTAYGCPTQLFPGHLTENTYCIQCTECIQACPSDNLALNLRPWGTDLVSNHRTRTDEAYLALLMLSITAFHGLTMTPNWRGLTDWLNQSFSLGHLVSFSLGMAALMLAPIAVYAILIGISYRLGRHSPDAPRLSYRDYFIRYAYALLPIALFYHLAHNLEHLLMEGPKIVALASDPFGWGWNLFGTLYWRIPPLVSLDVLWILQIALVLVGHVFSLWVAQRTSINIFGNRKSALTSQLPMLAAMICFSVFSLWLLKQPMEMRTSAM